MPELSFQVRVFQPSLMRVSMLAFKLRVENADAEVAIQSVALRCQIPDRARAESMTRGSRNVS